MLLLLTGPPSIGKDAVITEFLNRHPKWRYMAVEESAHTEFVPEGGDEEEPIDVDMTEFYVSLACQCAQALQKENIHLVAACERLPLPLQEFLSEEMGKELFAAHLGHDDEFSQEERGFYHCVIDTSVHTLKDILTTIDRLVGRKER